MGTHRIDSVLREKKVTLHEGKGEFDPCHNNEPTDEMNVSMS
jgi:hypothetical protein